MTTESDDLKKVVKDAYSEIARQGSPHVVLLTDLLLFYDRFYLLGRLFSKRTGTLRTLTWGLDAAFPRT